ncbi:MAG: HAD-IIA family hydrolase [Phycisphaerae bacterium]|nr:HAD-IIA family hydrolase [Phycisphaerae bacterium]
MAVVDQLRSIRHVALDMDGTIYKDGTLFDFTPAFLATLARLGIGYTFLTNNSSKSCRDYLSHLLKLGIEATADQLYTSTLSTIDCLRREFPAVHRLFVLGTPSLQAEFAEAGFELLPDDEEPQAVIVGFDTTLAFPRLCKAAWWIQRGKPFIATHPDRVCPTDQPTVLVDCGSVCACLQAATGQAPTTVLGKPDPRMLTGILARHALQPAQLAMVGDRLYTDMAMARRAGALGVLVLTGEATRDDATTCPEPPDLVLRSIEQLGELLVTARQAGGAP